MAKGCNWKVEESAGGCVGFGIFHQHRSLQLPWRLSSFTRIAGHNDRRGKFGPLRSYSASPTLPLLLGRRALRETGLAAQSGYSVPHQSNHSDRGGQGSQLQSRSWGILCAQASKLMLSGGPTRSGQPRRTHMRSPMEECQRSEPQPTLTV